MRCDPIIPLLMLCDTITAVLFCMISSLFLSSVNTYTENEQYIR